MKILLFPFFYLKEIVVGSLLVARDVVRPDPALDPTFLRLPLEELSPRQRLILACLISMTPGTVSIGEESPRIMIVHSLYGGSDPEAAIAHLKTHYEPFVAKLPI